MHKLRTLIEKSTVIFVRFNDKKHTFTQTSRHSEVTEYPTD